MHQKGIFKLFCQGLVLSLFTIALPAKAVVYSVFGNIEFVANGSNVSLLTGQPSAMYLPTNMPGLPWILIPDHQI